MRRSSPTVTRILWVVAIALLAVRMTDAHLHMCLDGQEPRSSWHVGDRLPHHDSSEDASHNDTDVSLGTLLLLKAGKLDSDDFPLVLLGALVLWGFVAPGSRGVVTFDRTAPPIATPFFLRPPLRGPPSINSL